MKSFILDGFLSVDKIFESFLENNPFLIEADDVKFVLYNQGYTDIAYQYAPVHPCGFSDLLTLYAVTQPLFINDNIHCHVKTQNTDERDNFMPTYVFSLVNPLCNEIVYIAALIVQTTDCIDSSHLPTALNLNYLEQFCYRLQMVFLNYEKLFLIIDSYSEMMATKENYLPFHTSNVANWCIKISNELQLSPKEHLTLYGSAILHDVGKLAIPDAVVNKDGKLTDEEFKTMKLHPVKGHMMLKAVFHGIYYLSDIPVVVRHHHEHYDGNGYPDGLKANEIPYLSRILCIADALDAMMTNKTYRKPKTTEESIAELRKGSGNYFDPELVKVVTSILENSADHTSVVTLNQSKFVNCASISFHYKDLKTHLSYSGNLILRNNKGVFILNSSERLQTDLDMSKLYHVSLSFFENHDFYEFTATVTGVEENRIEVAELKYMPTDRFFSMVWNAPVLLRSRQHENLEVEMLKLGGDSIVFQAPKNMHERIVSYFKEAFDVVFGSEVAEVFDLPLRSLPNKITKMYNAGSRTVYVTKFDGITSTERDHILRILFRRQVELRKHLHGMKV